MKTNELNEKQVEDCITIEQAKRIYSKGIAEGLIGMNYLSTYQMKDFNEVLKEVLNENSK